MHYKKPLTNQPTTTTTKQTTKKEKAVEKLEEFQKPSTNFWKLCFKMPIILQTHS